MSTLVEPGTRLAGRYRLMDRVSELDDSTLWRAIDEPLARPVAVRTFAENSTHTGRVIAAARAASRVTDSRLAQVFDADETAQQPYLVSEWIEGSRLLDLLVDGPLEPQHAVNVLREATDAVSAAHAAGLTHGRLDPSAVVWAKGGTVKITGLAIDAALDGEESRAEASVTDARALGALCYAALTAYWPGQTDVGLPSAPRSDEGSPVSVSQVRPEVPPAVATVTARALGLPADDGAATLDTPSAIREALAALPRFVPFPPQPAARQPRKSASTMAWETPSDTALPAGGVPDDHGPSRRKTNSARILLFSAVGALVLAATALGAWEIGRTIDTPGGDKPAATSPGGGQNGSHKLPVTGIQDYDPPASGGDGQAHPAEVANVLDGKAATAWTTQTYTGPNLGQLKPGVGLMLDMGRPVPLGSVRVDVAGQGATLELHAGSQPSIDQMKQVAAVAGASGEAVLRPKQPVRSRYLLVWITKLPPVSDGYRAAVSEIVVRGAG